MGLIEELSHKARVAKAARHWKDADISREVKHFIDCKKIFFLKISFAKQTNKNVLYYPEEQNLDFFCFPFKLDLRNFDSL